MIGFTTTIPLEVPLAAGRKLVDLNNIFINDPNPQSLIEEAEVAGFPRNICGWIKGIYGATLRHNIPELIAVTEGDCSNTQALMEVLTLKGVRTIPFSYPYDRSEATIRLEIEKLCRHFGTTEGEAESVRKRLSTVRLKVHEIDRMTWDNNLVSGAENHYFQVCTSDMNGDVEAFEQEIDSFLETASQRTPKTEKIRLAYIGVPPIFSDIYPILEDLDSRVVFNETQRQFSMPYNSPDLVTQYRSYTYPYDIFTRLDDIEKEIEHRQIDGIIHYVQSFCFRQIEDMIVRQRLKKPVLTLEGDRPGPMDARTRIRIEGFLEMIKAQKA